MKVRACLSLTLFLIMVFPIASRAEEDGLMLFTTEMATQEHCPSDKVVWLNTLSGVYHYKGDRLYGTTKQGAYVCEDEAKNAGDRPPRNLTTRPDGVGEDVY